LTPTEKVSSVTHRTEKREFDPLTAQTETQSWIKRILKTGAGKATSMKELKKRGTMPREGGKGRGKKR